MNNSGLVRNNQQSYYHLNFYELYSVPCISILGTSECNEYELLLLLAGERQDIGMLKPQQKRLREGKPTASTWTLVRNSQGTICAR